MMDKDRNQNDVHANTFASDKDMPELQEFLSCFNKQTTINEKPLYEKHIQEEKFEDEELIDSSREEILPSDFKPKEERNKEHENGKPQKNKVKLFKDQNKNKIPFLKKKDIKRWSSLHFTQSFDRKVISKDKKTKKKSPSLDLAKIITPNFLEDLKKSKEQQKIKKNANDHKFNKKTIKDNMVNSLFERKKIFAKKIRQFETEASPEKKYYRSKNMDKIWKDVHKEKNQRNSDLKKKEIEEKKNKLKKYEKMKIKKREPTQLEYLEEIHGNEPDFDELMGKIQEQKKILAQILSKISIKTFLVKLKYFFFNEYLESGLKQS